MSSLARTVEEYHGSQPSALPGEILDRDEPLILRGLVADWPAVQAGEKGPPATLAYLRHRCRNQEVVVFRGAPEIDGRFFYNQDLSGFNFERTSAALESMLTLFESFESGVEARQAETASSHYIGSTSVDACFPGFRQDNHLPIEVLNPLVSIWMGNRSRIAAHFDTPENIACVVAGRRRFTLLPPNQLPNLYVGPLDFTPAGQAISLVDFKSPDYQRFPLFREAQKVAKVAELEAGDAIYIPSMWWHHVESLASFNVLVNYWWHTNSSFVGNPQNVLIHALLGIRGLPEAQKRAWKGIFDHYIFSDNSQALAHIPDTSRGILGSMDEATANQLRAMLRSKLGA